VPGDWIVVEAKVVGCAVECYLNDIPVCEVGRGQARSIAMPVNQYAVRGANQFTLVARPGPSPATARVKRPELERANGASAIATISRYRENTVSGDGTGQVLATLSWAGVAGNEPEPFPAEVSATAEVAMGLGPWTWQNAEVLTLDDETVGAVANLIELIRGGLAAGDTSAFLDLGTTALREIARAYQDSPDQGVNTLRAVVDDGRSAVHWKFPPVPRDLWYLRLVAGGRMIECIAKDWEPIVRSITDGEDNSFSMPLMVGRSGGRWMVLR
jgi:hypothetical protein